jgi:hypothetical protein
MGQVPPAVHEHRSDARTTRLSGRGVVGIAIHTRLDAGLQAPEEFMTSDRGVATVLDRREWRARRPGFLASDESTRRISEASGSRNVAKETPPVPHVTHLSAAQWRTHDQNTLNTKEGAPTMTRDVFVGTVA